MDEYWVNGFFVRVVFTKCVEYCLIPCSYGKLTKTGEAFWRKRSNRPKMDNLDTDGPVFTLA